MTINYHSGVTSAAEVIAMLDETNPIHFAHIAEVFELCRNGERYSYNASDLISSARDASRKPRMEVPAHMAGWVAHRSTQRAEVAAAKKWSREILCVEAVA